MIRGPSGGGKTTMLNLIGTILESIDLEKRKYILSFVKDK